MKEISTKVNYASPLLNSDLMPKMLQLAKIMATSKTIPEIFQNREGDCLRIIELSYRVGQSPFAVADHCYFVRGKLSMEGKGVAAIINSSSKIVGSLHYKYSGDIKVPNSYICTVSGTIKGEDEPRTVDVSLALGMSDSNEKGAMPRWKKDPDQMLAYYGARVWARRFAPEVIAGLYTPEEMLAIPGATIDREYRYAEEIEAERVEIVGQYEWLINESTTIDQLRGIYIEVEKEHPEHLKEIASLLSKKKLLLTPPVILSDKEVTEISDPEYCQDKEIKNEMD
jgi:hypothetical protein